MKLRHIVGAGLFSVAALACIWLLFIGQNQSRQPSPKLHVTVVPKTDNEVQVTVPLLASPSLPKDDRPEVQTLYGFASAVKIFNFNPEIIYYQTNQRLRQMEVATPTHSAEIVRNFPWFVASRNDGSDTRANPHGIKEWYQCTGTWNEKAAVDETLAMLQRLGRGDIAGQLSQGTREYVADPIQVVTPDGRRIEVTPFHTIELKNSNITLRVEYRMDSNGPAGLTRWFYLGP